MRSTRRDQAIRDEDPAPRSFRAQLAALHEVSLELTQASTIDDLCRLAVELGRDRLGFERLGLWLRGDAPNEMRGTFGTDDHGETTDERAERNVLDPDDPPMRLFSGQRRFERRDADGRTVVAGLWDGRQAIGFLSADKNFSQQPFTEEEEELLTLYAATLGHLLTRIRAAAAVQASRDREYQFRERLAALHEVVLELAMTSTVDELSRRAVELGMSRLGFERLGLAFVSDEPGMMEGTFGTDEYGQLHDGRGGRWPVGPPDGPMATVLSGRARLVRAENTPLSGLGGIVGRGDNALAGLWNGTRSIGSLATDNLFSGRPLTDDDCELLTLYAASIGHLCVRLQVEEALREADRQKDQFIAMLAHELRNPLAPIVNACEILKRLGAEDPRLTRAREIIDRQVKHQARLLDDLLDISRVTRGVIELKLERLDLTRLVWETVEDSRSVLEGAGLRLHLDLPESALWIRGDATRLSQVVGNLLQNVVRFTNRGGDVFVGVTRVEGGARAAVTVRDTGIGIEPAMLPLVFDTFAQADRSLERSRGGLGLGLALVKGLVELHHGEVRADSAGLGHGAQFTILLPLEERTPDALPNGPQTRPGGARRARVLVVEDVPDTANSLRDLLKLAGCTVVVADSGVRAVEIAPGFRPEIVLCDLGLPGLNGFEVAEALRRDPATAGARLIALSGYGQEAIQQRCRKAGFDSHLTKPVDFVELERLLSPTAP